MSRRPLPAPEAIALLPPDGGPDFNHLIHERSPYLLQHARNPVDWQPWGPTALAEAAATDRPIFLSVGYSTCHWCHVMEHESFEDAEVAAYLNTHFVPIKVDREERPDLDDIYMTATQMFTQRGGWPNSVWLTPDGRPWYAGTYYPRDDQILNHPGHGQVVRPGFLTLLHKLRELWHEQRDDVLQQAAELSRLIARQATVVEDSDASLTPGLLTRAIDELRELYDADGGSFGSGAPRFPPHGALRLLLHAHQSTGDDQLLAMVVGVLRAMGRGGVHDHVGGGFHRYSTDTRWFLPHFEKMLYDNGQLGRAYAEAAARTGDLELRRVAASLFRWVLREMVDDDGGFHSALDADSEGEEGRFYVWEAEEVRDILGDELGRRFCAAYGIEENGNWQEEATREPQLTNVPHLPRGLPDDATVAELEAAKETLYRVRVKRVWPHLDDKVLSSWNGLMIGALAHGGALLDEPAWVDAAKRAATFAVQHMRGERGRLLATWRKGSGALNAYLDGYAFLGDGLLDLYAASGEERWLQAARELADDMLARFTDPLDGGLYFTPADHEQLLVRTKDAIDKAVPSSNGVAARLLVRLAVATGEDRYRREAERTLHAFAGFIARAPRATQSLLLAYAHLLGAGSSAASTEADATATQHPVRLEVTRGAATAAPGGSLPLTIRLCIADGFHIQAHRPSHDYLIATWLTAASEDAELGDVPWPEGDTVAVGGDNLRVYGGTLELQTTVLVAAEAVAGERDVTLALRYQACDATSCQRPETLRVTLPVTISAR